MAGRVKQRVAQLRRDLNMVAGGFVGRQPEPFRSRSGEAWVRRAAEGRRLVGRPVTVVEKTHPTEASTRLVLEAPDGEGFSFEPGQFYTLRVLIDGVEYRRAYSAAGLPGDRLELIAKQVEGGRVSNHLHAAFEVGDKLSVLGPSGAFSIPEDADGPLVFIAGGSGITPILSMIRAELRGGRKSIRLFYGNRGRADIIAFDELEQLEMDSMGRLKIEFVLSDPPRNWRGPKGLLDRSVLRSVLEAAGDLAGGQYFICGPSPMMDGAYAELVARGVEREHIHQEAFTRPEDRGASKARYEDQRVELQLADGVSKTIEVAAGKTILEAAVAEGIELPFSCAMGGCGACRVQRVDGELDLDSPNCLDPGEVEDGAVLTCVARPRSRVTLRVEAKR